jgi:hypothetical protein
MGYRTLLRQEYVTGHNNSNLTPFAALVADGEWELLLRISSHYCLIAAFINSWVFSLPRYWYPLTLRKICHGFVFFSVIIFSYI